MTMRAYLTSIGEKTTNICKWQLELLGFDVVMIEGIEPWHIKYKRFIDLADEDCLRIDADIILFNDFKIAEMPEIVMAQWQVVDYKKFVIHTGQPIYYSKKLLEIAKKMPISQDRPETSMWRMPEIIKYTKTIKEVVGLHQFPIIKL